ncbi:MAG: UbiX family flavin prenyltransferase [Phycisphaeraceae bacterium]
MTRRIIIGISGASGAAYARRTIQLLVAAGVETHLVVSSLGQRLLHDELGMEGIDLAALAGRDDHGIVLHHYRDVGAPIASGSFKHDGMVIIPCSSNTLSAVATGASANLLHRAAQVTLKERRKLVLVHRETPLSLVDIRNMVAATEAGAILCPANPGFYMLPRSIEDLVDFMVARVLDLIHVEHDLKNVRWGEAESARCQVRDTKSNDTGTDAA